MRRPKKNPNDRVLLDIKLPDKEQKLSDFLARVKLDEGLAEQARKQYNFQEIDVKVGYCQKIPKSDGLPGLGPIVESWTNDQFQICLKKVRPAGSSYVLAFKVENTTKMMSRGKAKLRECVDLTATSDDEAEGPSSSKRPNKGDDDRLWDCLKNYPTLVQRTEAQEERYQKFVEDVALKYGEKFTVINEKYVRCQKCEIIFATNKFNALNYIEKRHNCKKKSVDGGSQSTLDSWINKQI